MRAGVDVVATGNVHYATPEAFARANVLSAIRARRSLDEMAGWVSASPLAHLRSDAEQRRRFARWPGVVDAAGELGAAISPSTCAWSRRTCRATRRPRGWTSRRT